MNKSADIHVLHVDDEPDFAELAADMLEREDDRFTVETATSASDGLDKLAATNFDCIVSDYDMPGQNGIELLTTVRETYPDLPFILYTGKGSEAVASEAISAGVTDYLQKDGGSEQYELLANRIEDAVSKQRTAEQFTAVLEALPEGLLIVDADGTIQQVNERIEELFGYDSDTLVGEPVEMLVPDDRTDDHVTHRNEYMEEPETRPMGADLDLHGVTNDDEPIPVEISLSPVQLGGKLNVIAVVRESSDA